MAHNYFAHIKTALEDAASKENAGPMKAYMRNQFEFFGIKSPDRKLLFKELIAAHGLPDVNSLHSLIQQLWKQPEREYQYIGADLMIKMHKQWTEKDIELFEFMITHRSWWDTVDTVAILIVGPWLKKFPEFRSITDQWIDDKNMWLQRSAIIFQNGYKKSTDESLLYKYIGKCSSDKEFFIQKAIGWALREYSKTNPSSVKRFVAQSQLAPLSTREALRRIVL
jgi:3-methyladenine DNA glycosylase AlkD